MLDRKGLIVSEKMIPGQISIFEFLASMNMEGGGLSQQIAINKPIRLIELFAG